MRRCRMFSILLYLATSIIILYIFSIIHCIYYICYRYYACYKVTDVTHTDERLTTFLMLPTFHQQKNKNKDSLWKFLSSNFHSQNFAHNFTISFIYCKSISSVTSLCTFCKAEISYINVYCYL
jgi:hypothetical protein